MERPINDNAPFWYEQLEKRVENNRMWLKNRVIAVHHGDHETHFITTKNIWDFFKGYSKSEQGFTSFVNGWFIWRAPNADMTRFMYDPFTGERIDWDAIRRFYREHIVKE